MSNQLFEVQAYVDGVHYTKWGLHPATVVLHTEMLKRSTLSDDGKRYLDLTPSLIEELTTVPEVVEAMAGEVE